MVRTAGNTSSLFCTSVAFSPDGEYLATGHRAFGEKNSDKNGVALRNPTNGKEIRWLPAPGIGDLAFSPDGTRMVTGEYGGGVRVWDVESGEVIHIFSVHPKALLVHAVAFSPDGRWVVAGDDTGLVYFWNLDSKSKTP